jgi:hypothetical protein
MNANAQIVYTDINPDSDFTSGGGFDFNQDNTNEITTTNGSYFTLASQQIWSIGNINTGQWDVPKHLTINTVIDVNGNFETAGDLSMTNWGTGTPLPLNQDVFLGVKLVFNGNTYYGWARVMWDGTNFIYRDYAYQSTAGAAINAGDTGVPTGISNFEKNINFTLYPNPAKNTITIDNKSKINITEIKILDLLGKEVKKISISNNNVHTINISELNTGIYFISLFDNGKKIGDKKLIVE